nr:hypothetical protein [Magnetospirillum sp. LM-5]
MVRPSIRSTDKTASSILTVITRSSAFGIEKPIPSLQQQRLSIDNHPDDLRDLVRRQADIAGHRNRPKPNLHRAGPFIHMDMRGFARLVAIAPYPLRRSLTRTALP